MTDAEAVSQALDGLPDEVLLRVLAGAGSKAIVRAASCCQRLRTLAKMLQSYRCFSAAASTKADLGDALAEACDRALQGMLGCVDFALVFAANHDKLKGALAGQVVEGMLAQLPQGTSVVGCATSGLMGVAPGGPFELDPSEAGGRGGAGVSVLLGRMPGCRVRVFCNLPPTAPTSPVKRGGAAAKAGGLPALANTAVRSWLLREDTRGTAAAASSGAVGVGCGGNVASTSGGGPGCVAPSAVSAGELGLQSVWLLMAGSNAAYNLLNGGGGLLHWMQADEEARPVIAGGVSSGRGDLFFHPGRGPPSSGPGGSGPQGAEVEWSQAMKGLQYVGLAVMAMRGNAGGGDSGGGGAAASEVAVPELVLEPATAAAPAVGGVHRQQQHDDEEGGGRGVSEPPHPAVRACALSLRGCSGLPGQRVFERVALAREALGRRREGERGEGGEGEQEEDSEEDEGELVTVSGGMSGGSGPSCLVDELKAVVQKTRSMPYLAVWLARRGDASLHCGLNVEAFTSGKLVMGHIEPQLLALYGIIAFRTDDIAALEAISSGAGVDGAVVCCQLADITPEGCRLHLCAELPVLRSVCSSYPLLPGGRPDPRSWEGYSVVRRAALRAGARAGPVAMAVFSCTGRGRAIFGEASPECEARIADEVLQQGVPFVGAYCDGELGPFVRHSYAGWFFNPLCVQPPGTASGEGASAQREQGAGGAGGAAVAAAGGVPGGAVRQMVVAGGRVLSLDRTQMQGYTSVYAAMG